MIITPQEAAAACVISSFAAGAVAGAVIGFCRGEKRGADLQWLREREAEHARNMARRNAQDLKQLKTNRRHE